ncbi:UNKNOWN [Stylonychia lemnae]|uniref:Proteasome assembly chaperone 3 n=1 Tax=Stylonychia lemnae TaxID=5949 RepID=A0A078B6X0_STYLE|nr:UNKNOWN [Stylonychia lemnae]|eukprot:CDW89308.1 UNKNOWN [Stylonychia lemnae]
MKDKGVEVSFDAVVQRFSEKLLIVITDSQKFGNVISASYQRLDEQDQMMNMDPDLNEDLDHQEDNEDFKVEYSGHLLLGDREIQKWLELFAQNLLKCLLELSSYRDIQSIVLTLQFSSLRKIDKKIQLQLQKLMIDKIKSHLNQ